MKKFYFLTALFIALAVSVNAQPKFGTPTAFQKTINDIISKIPINIAGNQISISFEGDSWRGKLNGQDLLAGIFKIDEGPDGSIITIKQSFLYADTGKKVPITGKPIAAWVDTPGPELFFQYKKGPPVSILPISQEAAATALAALGISGGAGTNAAAAAVAPAQTVTAAAPAATAAAATSAATASAPAANIPQGPGEHDMIVLINGTILDAEVEEISPTQIKYRRVDNLTGPLFVVNSGEVYSVKYKNGSMDIINAAGKSPNSPILNPDKLYTGFSFEPSGFISGGPSITLEFSKGAVNSSFHASFPTLALNSTAKGFGFGAGASLNYYWGGPIGGFFMGGVFEWNTYPSLHTVINPYAVYNPSTDSYSSSNAIEEFNAHNFIFALNGGYKFVLKNGIYFRTGIAAGFSMSQNLSAGFYYKPDIATGYIF
jgi:hypothetical protein